VDDGLLSAAFQRPVRVDSSGKTVALVKFDASAGTGATSTNRQEFSMTAFANRTDTTQLPKAGW
jgi:hypothetical protein